MKVGRIPVASIILLVFFLATIIAKLFYPQSYHALLPYLDGGMIGALFVLGLYYVNIYLSAWMKNRKEASTSER
ncbi:hypothetical protein KXD93_04115 [Mucilaginibacter sp. BJC16-A38]|uniref:hypothetical protein n=1 Tax=Mucilaginibacter phenanthrenivorans TaxID=1234842 RepID=UPI0021585EBA|nr:hypothetical protein [Mucilaginibacter phenanthrenivorans]MCR8556808.1 hypothetical protein [Mucilaginibacter phenanthrenivorans]